MLTNLPTIAPPSLTAIRTEIHAPWTAVLDEGHNDDWAAIDQALSEPILEKLERFEIWCYSSREGFNPMDILRLKLPRLFKRGILWWHPFSTDPGAYSIPTTKIVD